MEFPGYPVVSFVLLLELFFLLVTAKICDIEKAKKYIQKAMMLVQVTFFLSFCFFEYAYDKDNFHHHILYFGIFNAFLSVLIAKCLVHRNFQSAMK